MAKVLLQRLLEYAKGKARQRPWLAVLTAIILGVAFFVVPPMYLSGQPQFLERYKSMEGYYRTWAESTHAEMSCEQCHVKPDRVDQIAYRVKMVGEFYLGIIMPTRTPAPFTKPPVEACSKCHYSGRTASPSGDLKIPHLAHTKVLKIPCLRCHKWVTHFKNPEGKNSPRMVTCLQCHNGVRATNRCTACHVKKVFPVSHRAKDWLIVHSQKQKEIDCKQCHGWVSNYCRACHKTRPRTHNGDWRTEHKLHVAQNRSCEACHQATFCANCHGEVPQLNIGQAPEFVKQ